MLASIACVACAACGGGGSADADPGTTAADGVGGAVAAASVSEGVADASAASDSDTIAGTAWTERDWQILDEKVRWAVDERLDTLPLGDALAKLGLTFVGTTYTPRTLEVPGPERLVVNLRELDCVTFVENALAMTWFVLNDGAEALADRASAMRRYEHYLTSLRYRDGRIDGYPSRLHYFSEWLADNERRGHVEGVTDALGGVPDTEPIDFMSTHPDAYRQLADADALAQVAETEARLNAAGPRRFLPEDAIAEAAGGIRSGDIIAATSTVRGLDIAHTGIAVWIDGRLHLLHAPLVGRAVEVSEVPLAERILRIEGQDGVMVARPLPWTEGS